MIKVEFKQPDRRCTFTDVSGEVQKWLTRIDEEEKVRERLENLKCTGIQFEDYDFQTWLDTARVATKQVIQDHDAGNEIEFKSKIWQPMRRYITHLFHDKCAYCEMSVEAGSPTHVEHYRPKSAIAGETGDGYYWLAYDINNYLPACQRCNNKKGTKFPLLDDGVRATSKGDNLSLEHPVLLNPAKENPKKHLTFVPKAENQVGQVGGTVIPKSKRGEKTIKLVGLNRLDLFEKRSRMQEQIITNFGKKLSVDLSEVKILQNKLENGETEFSAAQLAQVRSSIESLLKLFE